MFLAIVSDSHFLKTESIDSDTYGWTYTPAFGTVDGLIE
jgi:hypothetical protein